MVYRDFYIDGDNFDAIEGFYKEVEKTAAGCCQDGFEHSIKGLSELVHGGALLERADIPARLIWLNFSKSEKELPKEFLNNVIAAIRTCPDNGYPCVLSVKDTTESPFSGGSRTREKGLQPRHFFIAAGVGFWALWFIAASFIRGNDVIISYIAAILAISLVIAGVLLIIKRNKSADNKQIGFKILVLMLTLFLLLFVLGFIYQLIY